MKNLLLEKLDKAIVYEKQTARRIKAVEYTLSESMDMLEELMDAEEATDAAQRNLLIKLTDQYYALYSDNMSYEDCIDYAAGQVDKITRRIENRINKYFKNIKHKDPLNCRVQNVKENQC